MTKPKPLLEGDTLSEWVSKAAHPAEHADEQRLNASQLSPLIREVPGKGATSGFGVHRPGWLRRRAQARGATILIDELRIRLALACARLHGTAALGAHA